MFETYSVCCELVSRFVDARPGRQRQARQVERLHPAVGGFRCDVGVGAPAIRRCVEHLIHLDLAPRRGIAGDRDDLARVDGVRHFDDGRAVAQAEDGVLAVVVQVHEAPNIRRGDGPARELRERNLRLKVEVAARERAGHALRARGRRGAHGLERRPVERDDTALGCRNALGPVEAAHGERVLIARVDAGHDRAHLQRARFEKVIELVVAARRVHGSMYEGLRVDAAQIEDAAADLDGVAGLGLCERIANRHARRVVIEAVAGVDAARLHEARADGLVMRGVSRAGKANRGCGQNPKRGHAVVLGV